MFDIDIERILLTLPGILVALSFHEFAHGMTSYLLGDPTPKNQGRLTVNPLPHIDFLGFILLMFAGFGWAKPVMVNPRYYKNPKRDEILVSAAGPVMNLVMSSVFAALLKLLLIAGENTAVNLELVSITANIFIYAIHINIVLCIFNLLPIPPLDGFHILANIIPPRRYKVLYFLQKYSTIILLVMIITPVISYIISPPVRLIYNTLMKLFGMPMFYI